MKVRVLIVASALVLTGLWGWAQEPASPAGPAAAPVATPPVVDEEVKAKVEQLLELLDVKKTLAFVVDEMVRQLSAADPQVPPQFWAKVKEEVLSKEFLDLFVDIYAAHFTRQDIEELIDFWSSPVGQKFLREQPAVLRESVAASQEFAKGMKARLLEELQKWQASQKNGEKQAKSE